MPHHFELKDKVAIVTGGGTGIGKSIALEYAKAGAHVVVGSRKQENLDNAAAEIKALGGESLSIATDVRIPEQVDNLVKQTVDKSELWWRYWFAKQFAGILHHGSCNEQQRVIVISNVSRNAV